MKKKILCALLAACMAAVGAGCSAGDARVNFDADKPWSNYETSTYKIERFFMDGETRVKTVAEGTYVSTLRSDTDKTTVKNEFTLAYNNEPETTVMDERGNLMANKGLTINSTAKSPLPTTALPPFLRRETPTFPLPKIMDSRNARLTTTRCPRCKRVATRARRISSISRRA